MNAHGGFIIVWASYGSVGDDSSSSSIQAQLYHADGLPNGPQFQVNAYTTDFQGQPSVAMNTAGEFVVAWESYGSFGADPGRSVQAQRFNASAQPVSSQFQVNSYEVGAQWLPRVAFSPSGSFAVTFASATSPTDSSGRSVQARLFSADGKALGDQFQVNSYTTGEQNDSAIAFDDQGNFIVVWDSRGSSGNDQDLASIQMQRFNASGSSLGVQFQVNTFVTGQQSNPSIAYRPDGDFVVVWGSDGSSGTDASSRSVQSRRFAPTGEPSGPDFQVNSYTSGGQSSPRIISIRNGNTVVAWESSESGGTDDSDSSIQFSRVFTIGGVDAPSGDVQVNSHTELNQYSPSIASGSNCESVVVVWQSASSDGTDSDSLSIQARLFTVDRVFCDGFEGGDLVAWSASFP